MTSLAAAKTQAGAGTNAAPTFRVEGLSAFFGSVEIVKRVTLDIADRRVTAFMGPSGCGKSTFLRTLNRMHETAPDGRVAGRILFEGADLYAAGVDPVEVRSRIGMVFQKPNPFPKSIFDNVAYGPKLAGLDASRAELEGRVERALKSVGLWTEVSHRLKDSALGLSGGQQQRLIIARAIAADPKAILLDEPCSALDPASTARVEELIRELRSRFAIVIVTHSLAQAQRIADDVAFLHMGELVEHGGPDSVLGAPKDQRVRDYVSGKTG